MRNACVHSVIPTKICYSIEEIRNFINRNSSNENKNIS